MCKYSLATRDTIEMTNKMAEAGADAALVVTPCFYKNGMTSEALEKHFIKVSLGLSFRFRLRRGFRL